MSYYTPLPSPRGRADSGFLNVVDGTSTAVQRALRRTGLAGYEPPTVATCLALAEALPAGFNFFDVGANVGLYSSLVASLFDPANVVAFEPTPETARIARKIGRVNQLSTRVEEVALGRTEGIASLYLSAKSDASNSLVEGFKENVGTVDVAVRTLDGYVADSRIVPDVVKIDAETFEPEILAGAIGVLANDKPYLIVEVLNRKGHDHGVEMMQAMADLDYAYYPITPYSEWTPERTISGDPNGDDRDWLLAARPLPDRFLERFEAWEAAIARCTNDRNRSTLPRPRGRLERGREELSRSVARVRTKVAELVR